MKRKTPAQYYTYVRGKLRELTPLFARAAVGDFSGTVEIPDDDEAMAELYAGIEVLREVARRRVGELEQLNQALEQQNARLQAIISSMGEGLLVVDTDYKILLLNPAGGRLLGIVAAAAMNQDIRQLITSNHGEKTTSTADRPISKVLEKGQHVHIELKDELYWSTSARAAFPVALVATPLLIGKKVIGAVEIFHDVTEEKQVEQAKDEFISLASHQLRTPLSTIRWANERLLTRSAENLTLPQKEYLERIDQAARRMAELIQALLNISRLELGTLAVAKEPTDVAQLVATILSDLAQAISRKRLEVSASYLTSSALKTDPRLLRTIIENLLVNAIKFTPPGGHITIRVEAAEPALQIDVTDSGPGIPAEQQNKVFSRFFRASNVRHQAGAGLGLHLAQSMTERLGGKIWFTSTEGQGSTFSLSFPRST